MAGMFCRVHLCPDAVIIEPKMGSAFVVRISRVLQKEDLVIDRIERSSCNLPGYASYSCFGILGIIRLLAGPYLVFITQARRVAQDALMQSVFRIDRVQALPICPGRPMTMKQQSDEQRYLAMIQNVVQDQFLHFSYNSDITRNCQRIASNIDNGNDFVSDKDQDAAAAQKRWKLSDKRFVWNAHLLQEFVDSGIYECVLPVVSMFIVDKETELDGQRFTLLLISRRSKYRQGLRFTVRGADQEGNVANFVETEQVVIKPDGSISAFVQIRGSIPLLWSQPASLKWAPKVEISEDYTNSLESARKHFNQQAALYGDVCAVNLIDQKKDQLTLGLRYQEVYAKLQNRQLSYVWFDFHKECRKMKWANLSKLMDQVVSRFTSYGYFAQDANGKVTSLQTGVFRTNCMDNLDRTNVVQSLFARRSILQQFGLTSESVIDSPYANFEKVFKSMWADNADAMSLMYSGTGALKTDFTRTGKRTLSGALQDGINSLQRYYLNNFCDGQKQDALNLFLGLFEPHPHLDSPFLPMPNERSLRHQLLLATFVVIGIISALYSIGVQDSLYLSPSGVFPFFVALALLLYALVIRYIFKNGSRYVNKPRLRQTFPFRRQQSNDKIVSMSKQRRASDPNKAKEGKGEGVANGSVRKQYQLV